MYFNSLDRGCWDHFADWPRPAEELTAKVLVKTMDTASPTAERLEFGIVYKTPEGQVSRFFVF